MALQATVRNMDFILRLSQCRALFEEATGSHLYFKKVILATMLKINCKGTRIEKQDKCRSKMNQKAMWNY